MNKYGIGLLAVLLLTACDNNASSKPKMAGLNAEQQTELAGLLQQIKANLVFVEGGDFLMGDFGREYGAAKMSYDANDDGSPLHKVTLSSYSIGKFKTTNQEYQLYLKLSNRQLKTSDNYLIQEYWDSLNKLPNTPAHVDWPEADNYCTWLGKVSGLPFALPTEAQWEYAARSRGQFFAAGTNSGLIEMKDINHGMNVAGALDREAFAYKMGLKGGTMVALPVDSYPPNPLGLYDMAGNGLEWMHDWYDPEYYQHSPLKDPQGPEKPVFKDYDGHYTKVLRGASLSGEPFGSTMGRINKNPNTTIIADKTVRCVVNRMQPVK